VCVLGLTCKHKDCKRGVFEHEIEILTNSVSCAAICLVRFYCEPLLFREMVFEVSPSRVLSVTYEDLDARLPGRGCRRERPRNGGFAQSVFEDVKHRFDFSSSLQLNTNRGFGRVEQAVVINLEE